jgi:hypothetical protein
MPHSSVTYPIAVPDNTRLLLDQMARITGLHERDRHETDLTNDHLTRIILIAFGADGALWGYRLEVRTRDFQSLSRGSIPRIPIAATIAPFAPSFKPPALIRWLESRCCAPRW